VIVENLTLLLRLLVIRESHLSLGILVFLLSEWILLTCYLWHCDLHPMMKSLATSPLFYEYNEVLAYTILHQKRTGFYVFLAYSSEIEEI
jgi:hypothetical protein